MLRTGSDVRNPGSSSRLSVILFQVLSCRAFALKRRGFLPLVFRAEARDIPYTALRLALGALVLVLLAAVLHARSRTRPTRREDREGHTGPPDRGARAGQAPRPGPRRERSPFPLLVLGHAFHGKSTLVSALTRVLGRGGGADELGEAGGPGHPAAQREVRVRSSAREYVLADLPWGADVVEALFAGPARPGAILVVSAADGPMPGTREHVLLARQAGVPALVVFLNQVDRVDDPELIELVEQETRDLLHAYGFPGDGAVVVKGSALAARESGDPRSEWGRRIVELVDAMDRAFPEPSPDAGRPFLMPIQDVFRLRGGRGTVVTGRVERGVVKPGDEVALVGMGADRTATVAGVEKSRTLAGEARPGDAVGLLLREVGPDQVERGMVVAKPGSIAPHARFTAEVYVLARAEGGGHLPFFDGYRPRFRFRTADVAGVAQLPEGVEMVMPGDNVRMTVELVHPVAVEKHLRFAMRENGRTVGVGRVTEILP